VERIVMTDTDTQQPDPERPDEDNLERAADEGQLAGVGAEDAEEERGDDHSATDDPETKANEAGRGDIVGGLNMH
jgi:hypothetical protein